MGQQITVFLTEAEMKTLLAICETHVKIGRCDKRNYSVAVKEGLKLLAAKLGTEKYIQIKKERA